MEGQSISGEGVSVILPVHNEAASVGQVIEEIRSELEGMDYEIIAVDDGSTDGSFDSLDRAGAHLALIRNRRNMGYGFSLKAGMRRASHQNLIILDADGSYPISRMKELIDGLKEYEMVVGSRSLMVNLRTPARWFVRKLAELLTGEKIPDLNSGMRAMRKQDVERFIHLLPDSFSFTSTITIAMLSNGLDVKYIPIEYLARKGQSKIRPIHDTLNFIQLVVRMVLYFNPLKVFLPMSISLCLAGAAVLGFRFFTGLRMMNVTTTVLTLSGVQLFAMGLLADLINKRLNR